jgi:hypothetical protein
MNKHKKRHMRELLHAATALLQCKAHAALQLIARHFTPNRSFSGQ